MQTVRTGCAKVLENFVQSNGLVHLVFSKMGINSLEDEMDGGR